MVKVTYKPNVKQLVCYEEIAVGSVFTYGDYDRTGDAEFWLMTDLGAVNLETGESFAHLLQGEAVWEILKAEVVLYG